MNRTRQQEKSLHLWCELLAETFNAAGLDMRQVLRHDIQIPWSKTSVKEHIWRPVQETITGHESTTDPETDEYVLIYETLNRHLSEKFGITVSWPSRDSQASEALAKQEPPE